MHRESNTAAILASLRRHLRQQGWTVVRLARELGVGEATVKRWFAGRGLTLDRLDRLAALGGLTLGELARDAEDAPQGVARELTLAQERALSGDILLSFLFMAILAGVQPDEIAGDFALPAPTVDAALSRLERLALIDRLRPGKVRALVDRILVFRKAPLRALFERHMKQVFFSLDYAAPETVYVSQMVKLSAAGAAQLAELMETLRIDVQALADRDRETTVLPRRWYAMMSVMRELEPNLLGDSGGRAGSPPHS